MNPNSSLSGLRSARLRLAVTIFVTTVTALVGVIGVIEPAVAQPVTLSCLGGESLGDADLARGTTIVVVWASWSPKSRGVVERVNSLAGRWGGRARVVTVSFQEDRPAVERFLAGRSLGAAVCLDPEGTFSKKYNMATLPGLLVVKDGQVAFRGKLPEDPDRVIGDLVR